MPGELEVLLSRGVPEQVLMAACREAPGDGISPSEYLVRRGLVSMESLYSAVAEYCGVPFLPQRGFRLKTVNDTPVVMGDDNFGPVLLNLHGGETIFAIAPAFGRFESVRRHLRAHPGFARRIRIAAPEAIRHACSVLNSPAGELESRLPHLSAKHVSLSGKSGFLLIAVLLGLWMSGSWLMSHWFAILCIAIAVTCATAGLLRLVGLKASMDDPLDYRLPDIFQHDELVAWPAYTVLVPLYREARVVPDLVSALDCLSYPRDRLEILFLVEEDDIETRRAFGRVLPEAMELVLVPRGEPRTKPRALAYGLDRAKGDHVTVYDAEDRPDPEQLKKAALFFALAPPQLACLQARLVIDNAGESFISRQFALEYACLFDQLLPWCYGNDWPFPLGGTSNHFRKTALTAAGGWDKYNVTEDADLGVRLARLGYKLGVLPSATYEEAPVTVRAWLAQRSRWHKGWMQTVFVHGRDPARLVREIGAGPATVLAVLFLGTFLLILMHPLFAALLVSYGLGALGVPGFVAGTGGWFQTGLMLSAGLGFAGALSASWAGALRRGYGIRLSDPFALSFYWLLAAAAFSRAVWEFCRAPHAWNKTEHGVSKRRKPPRSDQQRSAWKMWRR